MRRFTYRHRTTRTASPRRDPRPRRSPRACGSRRGPDFARNRRAAPGTEVGLAPKSPAAIACLHVSAQTWRSWNRSGRRTRRRYPRTRAGAGMHHPSAREIAPPLLALAEPRMLPACLPILNLASPHLGTGPIGLITTARSVPRRHVRLEHYVFGSTRPRHGTVTALTGRLVATVREGGRLARTSSSSRWAIGLVPIAAVHRHWRTSPASRASRRSNSPTRTSALPRTDHLGQRRHHPGGLRRIPSPAGALDLSSSPRVPPRGWTLRFRRAGHAAMSRWRRTRSPTER